MAKLYKLLNGKVSRKSVINDDGLVGNITLRKNDTFVPSPSEYKSNKHRLQEAGDIGDDSAENRDAFLNTNLLDNPSIKAPKQAKGITVANVPTTTNICSIKNTEVAISTIAAISDGALLETLYQQELTNPDRVRSSVVKAIQARIAEVKAETKATV